MAAGTERERGLAGWAGVLLAHGDKLVYASVGLLFLTAALAMGAYSVVTFVQDIRDDFTLDLITFINDLLLVLIILEVLGTVRSYLASGATSLEPFRPFGDADANVDIRRSHRCL